MRDSQIPASLVARSRCVSVIPNVLKAAWLVGGYYGRGVMSCRDASGEWSPPVHVLMTGGSLGLQVGASSTDVVLFFMTTKSVRSLLVSKIKLSGEASVAAGPVGRGTEAATDGRFSAEIYSYARARGLFVGLSFAGGYLGVQLDDTRDYYGKSYTPSGVLFEHRVTSLPKSAWSFLSALPQPRKPVAQNKPKKPAPVARKPDAKKPSTPGPAAAEPPAAKSTVLTPPPPASASGVASSAAGAAPAAAASGTESAPAPSAPPIAPGPIHAPIEAPPPYGPAAPPGR